MYATYCFKEKKSELIILGWIKIEMVKSVRHLGSKIKKCQFICSVNKLISNFQHLQRNVLVRLFKLYCCSFYGSSVWKYQSKSFQELPYNYNLSWNIAVHRILRLPY